MEASRKREGKGPFSCHLPRFNTDVVLHIAVGITSPFHRVRSLIQTSHRTLAVLADSKGHLLASWSSQGLRSSRCPSCGLPQGRSAASMCGGVPQACRGSPSLPGLPGPGSCPSAGAAAGPEGRRGPGGCKARPGAAGRSGVTAARRQPHR